MLDMFWNRAYNIYMEKNKNYHFYNNFGIYELRNIAREKGVKSPTTKKREILIEEIIKLDCGKIKPYIKKTKQGRPCKQNSKIDYNKLLEDKKFYIQKEEKNYIEKIFNFLNDFKILTIKLNYEITTFLETNKEILKEE